MNKTFRIYVQFVTPIGGSCFIKRRFSAAVVTKSPKNIFAFIFFCLINIDEHPAFFSTILGIVFIQLKSVLDYYFALFLCLLHLSNLHKLSQRIVFSKKSLIVKINLPANSALFLVEQRYILEHFFFK